MCFGMYNKYYVLILMVSQVGCKIIAVLLQFLFSAAFCWMLVEGGLLLQGARVVSKQLPRMFILMLIGWGMIPASAHFVYFTYYVVANFFTNIYIGLYTRQKFGEILPL